MGRIQILYVENDPIMRDRMQQMVGQMFSICCVDTVTEAKRLLHSSLPDILITEVRVGAENGLELCSYVRKSPTLRPIPIMLLTSLATLQDKIAGFDAGADDYVVKPCDAHHLQARIRLLFRIKRIERHSGS